MCLLSERAHMICQTHVDPEPRGRLAAEAARRARSPLKKRIT